MNKLVRKGLVVIGLFFCSWLMIAQIEWAGIFKIQEISRSSEKKIGSFLWSVIKSSEEENKTPLVINSVDTLLSKICLENDINKSEIKIHVVNKKEVNAFVLPDGHLIIYSGLILDCDNQDELCGVICHEIAHVQLNHVMKKLINEVGISALISIVSGGGDSEMIDKIVQTLTSSAFNRSQEKEADLKAVSYLIRAGINSKPFADFLLRLSKKEEAMAEYLKWISTHPISKQRARYIIDYSKAKNRNKVFVSMISENTWKTIKKMLK